MKILTIGRDPDNNIVLDDSMISRRHATLRIHPTGRIEIVDYSANGTYVNGAVIPANTPVRVTRKDSITFARTKSLDWGQVSDPYKKYRILAASLLVVIIALFGTSLVLKNCKGHEVYEPTDETPGQSRQTVPGGNASDAQSEQSNADAETTEDDSDLPVMTDDQVLNKVDAKKRAEQEARIAREKARKEAAAKAEAERKKAEQKKADKKKQQRKGDQKSRRSMS